MIKGIEKVKDTELLDNIYQLYNELIEGSRGNMSKDILFNIIDRYIWGDGKPICIRDAGVYEGEYGYKIELLVENDYQHINEKIHLYVDIDKQVIRDNIINKIIE